jgi:hypothetical protein
MKYFFFIFVFIAKLEAATLPQIVLNKSLNQRCYTYLNHHLEECQKANAELVNFLDFDFVAQDPTIKFYDFISFKKLTIQKLSDKKTQLYLKELNFIFDKVLNHQDHDFNLWNFTLNYFSEKESMAIMASLFQDTSDAMTHIHYLHKHQRTTDPIFLDNLKNLESILRQIQLLQVYRKKDIPHLLFPQLLHRTLSSNIYHFYVPLYLSSLLDHSQFSFHISSNVPLLFIAVYEMVSHEMKIEYLFFDPFYFRSVNGVKDLYNAYLARQFFNKHQFGLNFHEFKKQFDENTTEDALLNIIQ